MSFLFDLGGGWYQLPDGSKVQGRDAVMKAGFDPAVAKPTEGKAVNVGGGGATAPAPDHGKAPEVDLAAPRFVEASESSSLDDDVVASTEAKTFYLAVTLEPTDGGFPLTDELSDWVKDALYGSGASEEWGLVSVQSYTPPAAGAPGARAEGFAGLGIGDVADLWIDDPTGPAHHKGMALRSRNYGGTDNAYFVRGNGPDRKEVAIEPARIVKVEIVELRQF